MGELVTVSIRMSKELKARLEIAAEERVVSKSLLARRAIEHYLDTVPDLALYALRQSASYDPPSRWERLQSWLRGD
jgi:predicted DNA-binding protein